MKVKIRLSAWTLAATVVLNGAFVRAAEPQDVYARCEPQLGSKYDTLSPVDRLAKQDKYFNCVTKEIYGRLKVGLHQALMQLNRWRARNSSKVQSKVRVSRQVAQSELDEMHDEERSELISNRANQIERLSTEQNTAAKRNEINAKFTADIREMNISHSADQRELGTICQECVRYAWGELVGMWEADFQNLVGQYQTKSASVRSLVSQIRNTPFDSSVNNYLSSNSGQRAVLGDTPPLPEPPPAPSPDATAGLSEAEAVLASAPPLLDTVNLSRSVADATPAPATNARAAITNAPQPITPAEPMGPPIPEIIGQATYEDGTVLPVRMGDNVQGPCQINFIDDTSLDLTNPNITIDEYVYDPAPEDSRTNFSTLREIIVFSSGLVAGPDEKNDKDIESIRVFTSFRGASTRG